MPFKPLSRWLRALADRLDPPPAATPAPKPVTPELPGELSYAELAKTVNARPLPAGCEFAAAPRVVPADQMVRTERRQSERRYDFGQPIAPPRPASPRARQASIDRAPVQPPPPDVSDFLVPFLMQAQASWQPAADAPPACGSGDAQ